MRTHSLKSTMNKILILFAHPLFEKSRVHKQLIDRVGGLDGITINDLYQAYPDFDIDISQEMDLLNRHEIIIWQHPFYWYSAPAMIKQWQDLVLAHGWAYGKGGRALEGKKIFNSFTSGGGMEVYQPEGFQKYTVREFLRPFERTAHLCRMIYWPPFWVPGTHKLDPAQINLLANQYRDLLIKLRDGEFTNEKIESALYLNDLVSTITTII